MTFRTALPEGSKVRILLNSTSATLPVQIDWGNGVPVNYTVDPSQMSYNRWIDGAIAGSTISITGNITEASIENLELTTAYIKDMSNLTSLNLSNNQLYSFELEGQTPLKDLNLGYNKLQNTASVNASLTLENAAQTLESLTLYHNPGLEAINISTLTNLKYLAANDCPDLYSVFICKHDESRPALISINLSNCSLMHFYPVSLPNLTSLYLNGNELVSSDYDTSPFVLGNYPKLTTLSVADNSRIESLDITGCKQLESLAISNCKFKNIDLSQAPNLTTFSAANNNISFLDMGNNPNIQTINIAGNPIKEFDFSKFLYIKSIDVSNTQISRLDLMKAFYLEDLAARNTNIEFIDLNGLAPGRVKKIDIRDNKNMTGETMTYTLRTLPEAKASSGATNPNLLIDGSNYEHAYTAIAEDMDHHWTLDVHGDGTALNTTTSVTLLDATDTGENKTGETDRIYQNLAFTFKYDFDVYETDGGKFLLVQWQPIWWQTMKSVINEAYIGVPIYVYPYPEEGKKFKSVTVNGQDILSQWFVISESSEIKVNFTSEENAISFTTTPGQNLSLMVNTVESNGTVWIDWGTGNRQEYNGQNRYDENYADMRGTRIDGSAAAATVTIYGNVAALDLEGFGDAAEWFGLWDNAVTSIDLSNADNLKYLNLYWNPLDKIDLSGAPNLRVLDVSFTNLKELDLSGATGLLWLDAYSDGIGEDGISMLKSIDLSSCPLLQHLTIHNNELSTLDLSNNPYLWYLKAGGNLLTAIDLSNNTLLESVSLQTNQLTSLDVSKLLKLTDLTVSNNLLTSLDLSKNTQLDALYIDGNQIKTIDLSKNTNLRVIYLNDNGMSADDLNDTYYLLPQRKDFGEEDGLGYNIAVVQGNDKAENDGTLADSSIALDRGWKPSHLGANQGSQHAYLDILPSAHGSVIVKDADGKEYGHGHKVPKYSELTIEATPDEGYVLSSFRLNSEDPSTGNKFTMPGIYTKLYATFAKGESALNDIAASDADFTVAAAAGRIDVRASACVVDIYTLDGRTIVASETVEGTRAFPVATGVYLVRATINGNGHTFKLAVK